MNRITNFQFFFILIETLNESEQEILNKQNDLYLDIFYI